MWIAGKLDPDGYLCENCERYVISYVAEKRKKDPLWGKYKYAIETGDMKETLC
jgi:hypothetical protein